MASAKAAAEPLIVDPYLESTQRHFWLFDSHELGEIAANRLGFERLLYDHGAGNAG